MQSVGELAAVALGRLGSVDHVQAEPGDYIGDDGLLHCGVCNQAKEHKFAFNGHFVPCMCQCAKEALAREEA